MDLQGKWISQKNGFELQAGLHYGGYHSKLVHFEAQKNIFYVKKGPSLK